MATIATESRYKSFMKPVKFWQKQPKETNNDEANHDTQPTTEEEVVVQEPLQSKSGIMSSFHFNNKKKSQSPALTETKKGEVYKLSTIDQTGIYMPPSPTLQGKRDNWIEVNEDIMDFRLPSSECLTTHVGEKHDFFTPSVTFVRTSQPYIFPMDSRMSDSSVSTVPSFIEDNGSELTTTNSCRSSASFD